MSLLLLGYNIKISIWQVNISNYWTFSLLICIFIFWRSWFSYIISFNIDFKTLYHESSYNDKQFIYLFLYYTYEIMLIRLK